MKSRDIKLLFINLKFVFSTISVNSLYMYCIFQEVREDSDAVATYSNLYSGGKYWNKKNSEVNNCKGFKNDLLK